MPTITQSDLKQILDDPGASAFSGFGVASCEGVEFRTHLPSPATHFCNHQRRTVLREQCKRFYARLSQTQGTQRITCPAGFNVGYISADGALAGAGFVVHLKTQRTTAAPEISNNLPRAEKKAFIKATRQIPDWINPGFSTFSNDLERLQLLTKRLVTLQNEQALGAALVLHKDFVSTFSHESLNPIQQLRTNLEAASSRLQSTDRESYDLVEDALQAVDRLRVSIEGVRVLFSKENEPLKNQFLRRDLLPIIKNWAKIYTNQANEKGLTMHMKPAGGPWFAYIIPEAFELLINNLLSNAIKYSFSTIRDKNGRIDISFDSKTSTLAVANYGVMIPEEDIQSGRIYEMARRGSTANERDRQGTGVGLHLVKTVAKMHGTEIRCTSIISNPGRSTPIARTEFAIRLPSGR